MGIVLISLRAKIPAISVKDCLCSERERLFRKCLKTLFA